MTDANQENDAQERERAVRQMLHKAFELRRAEGLIPFEGRWLSRNELATVVQPAQCKVDQKMLELCLLLALLLGTSILLLLLLWKLVY